MLKHASNTKKCEKQISLRKICTKINKKEKKMDEIPVKIGRHTKWISGINENTKCVDIVTGVLIAEHLLDVSESDINIHYALVEMWRGVTKVLSGNSPILRIWKAWADEQSNVCFIVKRIRNPRHDRESSISKPAGSGNYNLIEKMRNHVKEEEITQKTKKKITRRNSSINRQRRPPDTFHPNAVKKDKQELCESIEEKMRVMILQSEALKEEISKLQKLKLKASPTDSHIHRTEASLSYSTRLRPRDQSQDTSEDSGIVTDDSEAKSVVQNTKYFEVRCNNNVSQKKDRYVTCEPKHVNNGRSDLPLKPPPDDPLLYQWVGTMDKISKLNKLLEEKEEQIIALQYEYKMMKDNQYNEPCPLDCFNTEVIKYREINAKLLEDITVNRKHIEKVNEDQNATKKVINQLEFDINLVEREGKRLENGLSDLQNINLTFEDDTENRKHNSLPPRLNDDYDQLQLPITLPNIRESIHHETNPELPVNTLV
eukprot:TRINITY_DN17912_c0_g1_i1.p1 TRINITY_DN17912_c0_g1~~TRINITY_DN17912_c0_g1_i1.p1  ORF type:complete len:485 (+),score=87.12 TRINITY_DN17912_c0_g1_i1:234-1688(+)